jgi:hypothetical protein
VRAHTRELKAATKPDARAGALRALAADYDAAAVALARLRLTPSDSAANARVVAALDETSRKYENAASGTGGATQPPTGQPAVDRAVADAGHTSSRRTHRDQSGVGDSRSDDPSDDAPDDGEP